MAEDKKTPESNEEWVPSERFWEGHERIIKSMMEFQKKLDNMTPEERAKEEAFGESLDRWLHLDELVSPDNEDGFVS